MTALTSADTADVNTSDSKSSEASIPCSFAAAPTPIGSAEVSRTITIRSKAASTHVTAAAVGSSG